METYFSNVLVHENLYRIENKKFHNILIKKKYIKNDQMDIILHRNVVLYRLTK